MTYKLATDQNRTDISSLEGWGNNHYTTVAFERLLYQTQGLCVNCVGPAARSATTRSIPVLPKQIQSPFHIFYQIVDVLKANAHANQRLGCDRLRALDTQAVFPGAFYASEAGCGLHES